LKEVRDITHLKDGYISWSPESILQEEYLIQ